MKATGSRQRLLEEEKFIKNKLITALVLGEESGFINDFDPEQNLKRLHEQNL